MTTATAVKITGKNIAAFWARAEVGTQMECVENTYIPSRAGLQVTVTRPGKTTIGCGRGYNINPPKRVSDVVALTEDSITYKLAHREGHTVTWKFSK